MLLHLFSDTKRVSRVICVKSMFFTSLFKLPFFAHQKPKPHFCCLFMALPLISFTYFLFSIFGSYPGRLHIYLFYHQLQRLCANKLHQWGVNRNRNESILRLLKIIFYSFSLSDLQVLPHIFRRSPAHIHIGLSVMSLLILRLINFRSSKK